MKNKTTGSAECSPTEKQFRQRLPQRPELWQRFQSILELTNNTEDPLKTADEMEERLIQE